MEAWHRALRGVGLNERAVRLGRRIRALRDARDWSQAELAARLGRTQTAISYWESGSRSPGLDDLADLAEAFGVSTTDLLADALRRPLPTLLRAIAEDVDAASLADQLEEFARHTETLPKPTTRWRISPASPRDTAENLLAIAEVSTIPIPVDRLAKGCGVRIVPWQFDNIDGLVIELDSGAAIWVNDNQADTRQRFTIAHELGHHLLRHADRFHVDFGGELAPGVSGEHPSYNWRAERAANEFAANLLMPASYVRPEFHENPSVPYLAGRFNVSAAAMGFRLSSLGLR